MLFFRCTFSLNLASSPLASFGGGVYYTATAATHNFRCDASIFKNNTAGNGGALSISSALASKIADATVGSSSFSENTAFDAMPNAGELFFGGAVSLQDAKSVTFSSSNFSSNSATGAGAVNIIKSSTPQFSDCLFESNLASGSSSGGGAVVVSSSAAPAFARCVYRKNSATFGGAISVDTAGQLHASAIVCDSNIGRRAGGCLNFAATGAVTIAVSTFTYNTALSTVGGGVLYSQHQTSPVFDSCIFKQNTAPKGEGGVLKLYSPATASFLASRFEKNSAAVSGGVSMIEATQANFTSCTFAANKVEQMKLGGGALALFKTAVTVVSNCTFTQHHSFRGAVVFVSDSKPVFRLSTFKNNVGTKGGVVYSTGASTFVTVDRCVVDNNRVTGESQSDGIGGGAMYVIDGTVRLFNSSVQSNVAEGDGGALWVGPSGAALVERSTLANNQALAGGAIWVASAQAGLVMIIDSRMTANSANEKGGALLVTPGGYCQVNRSLFTDSRSPLGAAIHTSGHLLSDSTVFETGVASTFGGGVFTSIAATNMTRISNSEFKLNRAGAGAALYFESGQTARAHLEACCTNCQFQVNEAEFYGPNWASDISALTMGASAAIRRADIGGSVVEFRGGVPISPSASVELRDVFDTVVSDHVNGDAVECSFGFPDNLTFVGGEMLAFTNQGTASFIGTTVAGVIGDSYSVDVKCRWERCSTGSSTDSTLQRQVMSTWSAIKCLSGEETLVSEFVPGEPIMKCRKCGATTFSLGRDSFECTECPEGAECPGGDEIVAEEGE